MSKLIGGNFSWSYASIQGSNNLTSDQVSDIGTGHTLSYDIADLESHIGGGGASLTGDIVIGTTYANTISVNSGQTTYINNEIIKVKDNAMASIRLQCNDAGPTDLMILNTTNGSESMYLPLQYIEIGNVTNGGVQIGDGTNAGATNIYGIVSLKNSTDSTNYTSTNCSNVVGGLSIYKKLNVGGNIVSSGSITTGNNVGIIFNDSSSVPCKIYNKNAVGMTFNYNNTDYAFLNNNGLTLYPSTINLAYSTSSGNATIRMGSNLRNMLEYDVTNDITYINAGLSINKIGISNVLNTFGASNNTGFLNTSETTSSTDTNASVYCAGGMAVAKKLYVGSSINSSGSINGTAITSTGNINAYGNTIYGGSLILTGAISGTTITGTGALNIGTNTITSGTINSSGNVNCGLLSCQNLFLPTSGGTATSLRYYEEYTTLVNNWAPNSGGPWLNSTNTMTLIRIGNIVNLKIKAFSGDAMGSFIHNFAVIPSRFCPSGSAQFPIQVINVSTTQLGLLSVLSTGYTNIYSSITSSNFGSGIGSGLLVDTFVSWTMI